MWYVYLLKCFDDTIYTGATNNVEKRVAAHNAQKGAKYTRGRTPVILLKSIPCKNRSAALSLEAKIKKLTQQQKLDLCCDVLEGYLK